LITDTQILSYYFKGKIAAPSDGIRISSVTASEFLLIQDDPGNKANYYPIHPAWLRHPGVNPMDGLKNVWDSKKHAAMEKHRTDKMLVDFGGQFEPYVEFGSLAITEIINNRLFKLFYSGITHLEKKTQKTLKKRMEFVLDSGVQCIALNEKIACIGVNLFSKFISQYSPKANIRNTVNDLLILSSAVHVSAKLLSGDKLLNRFYAEVLGAPFFQPIPETLEIDFRTPPKEKQRKILESKGYINKGWQIIHRK
jgi:hypothetical protein